MIRHRAILALVLAVAVPVAATPVVAKMAAAKTFAGKTFAGKTMAGKVVANGDEASEDQARSESPPVPLSWVPSWLMDSLSRAIADATDTRDRHAER